MGRSAGADEVDEAGVALCLCEEEVCAGLLRSGKEHDPDERRVLRDLEGGARVSTMSGFNVTGGGNGREGGVGPRT